MNEELDVAFKDYIEKFKELDIKDKRVEVVNSLKEIVERLRNMSPLEADKM